MVGSPLLRVNDHKCLDSPLTSNLSWSKKNETYLPILLPQAWRTWPYAKASSFKLEAYNTIIRPKLEYASVVWDPVTGNDFSKLEMVQRRAVRHIFAKFRRHDLPSPLMKAYDISALQRRKK